MPDEGTIDQPGGDTLQGSTMGGTVSSPPPVDPTVIRLLTETKPWVRFMSILGFIGCGFLVIAGIIMGAVGTFSEMGPFGGLISIVYIAMAVLYIFPALFLFRYADAIRDLARWRSTRALEGALDHQRRFWRFVGIFTIVVLGLYVVGLFIAMIVGIASL
ncbi:MAG: hypothetical protein JW819_11575 [Candidatus Krumholzibacteriota bacterium]|nr:hypothetical protein [Candidatus Krumholzibacteriota bacterium]